MSAKRIWMVLPVALLLLAPRPTHAETLLTPFAGVTFGGDANSSGTFGASITQMGGGIFGVEGEFAYSPSFFDDGGGNGVTSSKVVTAMVNLIIGAPIGTTEDAGFKPYVSAGLGVIKTSADGNLDDHFSNNDFGMNFGAGGIAFINEHIGLRGDIRYFRALTDPEEDLEFDVGVGDLDFWRASFGLTFRF